MTTDGHTLLLLHGMGGNAAVWSGWRPLLDERWPGPWRAVDLPGHGAAPPLARYTFDALAAAVAAELDPGPRYAVIGHSLGGVVGLALAAGTHGVAVGAVVGVGVKVAWSAEELTRAAALAARPAWSCDERAEAARRFLRVAGLEGLVDADHPAVGAGIRKAGGRWRLAMDPAAYGVGAPDMAALLAACPVPVLLARGAADPMVDTAQLAALGRPPAVLDDLGHSAHVESPGRTLALLAPLLAPPGGTVSG
ncbi:alpha/beta hydrolase [Pilimelia terevasa]|uniref:Alpha/beta hydrolase n=1 Tax=Pilimelia terevasa TaxID=53372 RepID=A0A8J3BPP1_9ACTN|nr:alpha/beta fold hydrolase [Pilimelia terevasa]GGK39424.1 alpha/beta hydrolase [Pilimelia terevasa]